MKLLFGRFEGRDLGDVPPIYSLFLYLNRSRIKQKDIRDYLNKPGHKAHYGRVSKLFNKHTLAKAMKEFLCDLPAPPSTQGVPAQTKASAKPSTLS